MFETERFVADCRAAFAKDPTHKAVREVLARAVSDPAAVLKGLGEPQRAEIQKIYHSAALTILNVVWAPGMMVMPHNHRMWAVDRYLHRPRRQCVLATPERTAKQDRSCRRQGTLRNGCRAAGHRHHSFRHQSDQQTYWRHPHLWWCFFCRRTQRVGLHDATRTSVRRRTGEACVRRGQRTLRGKQTHSCKLTFVR